MTCFLYKESGLDDNLRSSLVHSDRQYYVYGAPAYIPRPYLQVGFEGTSPHPKNWLATMLLCPRSVLQLSGHLGMSAIFYTR
jgi:hypothetical protein